MNIDAPASYTSGASIPITVTVSDSAQRRWGFQLSARTEGGQQAGTLVNSSSTRIRSESGIQYIEHSNAPTTGTGAGFTFSFTWTAPDTSIGPVTFYAAGNAANGNGSADPGDHIYTTNRTIQPQAAGPTPSISEGGVVSNASFAAHPAPVAPGTLIAIFGSDLTENGATADDTFLGPDDRITTTLAGASVRINGIDAPMLRAFPGQLVAQVPVDLPIGTATIEATVGGQTSASRTFNVDAITPGIFSIPPSTGGQGAVLISNSTTIVAPAGSIPGRITQPAAPGDFITIFCTGLGQVTPPVETGQLAPGQHTTAPTTVTIGGITANAAFSGLAPGFAGLYQVDVQVPPAVPPGDAVPLLITVGGVQSNTVTIAVSSGQSSSSNPAPTIASLSPSSFDLDLDSLNVTILGTGFTQASTVTLNGVAKTAAYVSASQLTVLVTVNDFPAAGDYPLVVTNPAPGGGSSSPYTFRARQPASGGSNDYY